MKKKINIGIIIYGRTTSTRLINKIFKKINGETLLELVYLRTKKGASNIPIIINTTKLKSDDKIVFYCKKNKINYFRGNLKNVFNRTVQCCKKFSFDAFVRVNADRPFFDYNLMKKMIKIFLNNNYDIVTNQMPNFCSKGLACEVASSKIFYRLNQKNLKKNEKEHIFNYFYENRNQYKILNLVDKFYKSNKNFNLSLDTKLDLKRTKRIYNYYNNYSYVLPKTVLKKFKQ